MTPVDADAASEQSPINLQHYLPYRLAVLSEVVAQGLAKQYLGPFAIAIPEWRVLAALGEFEVMTAKAIGQHSRMHKTKVSRAVTSLEERKLVAGEVSAHDRREINLRLTESGKDLYWRIVPLAKAYQADIFDGIDQAELDITVRVLEAVFAKADA